MSWHDGLTVVWVDQAKRDFTAWPSSILETCETGREGWTTENAWLNWATGWLKGFQMEEEKRNDKDATLTLLSVSQLVFAYTVCTVYTVCVCALNILSNVKYLHNYLIIVFNSYFSVHSLFVLQYLLSLLMLIWNKRWPFQWPFCRFDFLISENKCGLHGTAWLLSISR